MINTVSIIPVAAGCNYIISFSTCVISCMDPDGRCMIVVNIQQLFCYKNVLHCQEVFG